MINNTQTTHDFFHWTARAVVDEQACIGCGRCVSVCPNDVFSLSNKKAIVGEGVFLGCLGCGQCASACPERCISVSGRRYEGTRLVERAPKEALPSDGQFEALLLNRRSVRNFAQREVDRALVDRLLEMISLAPMGIPPSLVGITVFHGRDKVRAFSRDAIEAFRKMRFLFNPWMLFLMRPFVKRASFTAMRDFIRPLFDVLTEARPDGVDPFTFNAPLALLFHHDPLADTSDCAISATYAMLAAESLGLGSCMLGTAVALGHSKQFLKKYGIPESHKTGLALVVGYPAVKHERALRRPMASVNYA